MSLTSQHDAQHARELEEALAACRENPSPECLPRFFAELLDDPEILTDAPGEVVNSVLRQRRSKDAEHAVGVALLHLLHAAPDVFNDPILAARAEALWDRSLGDIYRSLNIRRGDSAYDKRQALMDAVPRAETEITRLLEDVLAVRTTAALKDLRQRYKREFSRHLPILEPFLPSRLMRTRIDEAFEAVQAVFESDDTSLSSTGQRSSAILRNFRDEAEEFGTAYAADLLAPLAEGLQTCIDAHSAERILDPADVRLLPGDKKYPLHEHARAITLALRLENRSQGPALHTRLEFHAGAGVSLMASELYIGTVRRGQQVVAVQGVVDRGDLVDGSAEFMGVIRWTNADGSASQTPFDIRVLDQGAEVDWNAARSLKPYRLTEVTNPTELVGRDQLIDRLAASVTAEYMTSSTISGQKRVGKTSIVKSLETRLEREAGNVIFAYLLVGPHKAEPRSLYRAIARQLRNAAATKTAAFPGLSELEMPTLEYGFSDLLELVDEILAADSALRIVLVLDEFDEIPARLYQQNDEAGAFFNTLRSLTAHARTSVILVGGENLPFVLTVHGAALNRVEGHRVDIFRRHDEFDAFAELVRRPAAGILEFAPDAIEALYDESAGHPYFAKLICESLFVMMTDRRDSSVTAGEVQEAIDQALAEAQVAAFAHFWDDGIHEIEPGRKQEIARTRRLTLLALARALRTAEGASREQVSLEATRVGMEHAQLAQTLTNFEHRGVLLTDHNRVTPTIPFFRRWLQGHGTASIITEHTDAHAQAEYEKELDAAAITGVELSDLVNGWGLYRNRLITAEGVRSWLAQFGGVLEQRRALNLLKQLRFFSSDEIHRAFNEAYQEIARGWKRRVPARQQRLTDVLVVPLSEQDESGYAYGRTFADVNGLHRTSVVPLSAAPARLRHTRRELGAVVLLDDFIWSGRNVIARLAQLDRATMERLRDPALRSTLVVLAAFQDGIAAVEHWLSAHDLPIRLFVYEELAESDRVFHPSSRFFDDPVERAATKKLFDEVGREVSPAHPLGRSESQAFVVFDSSVPNNSLPHLWAERGGAWPWKPLFERF